MSVTAHRVAAAPATPLPAPFDVLPAYSVSFPEGTMSHTTFNIVRDNEGLLWVATANGIDRYDGLTFKHYRISITQTQRHLRDGFQPTLYKDEQGDIWAFTERSLAFRYNRVTDRFDQIIPLSQQPHVAGLKSMAARDNMLHMATSSGIRLFDMEADSVIQVIHPEEDMHYITSFTDGNYLYGTMTYIGVYDPRTRATSILCDLGQDIQILYYDPITHFVWAGTNGAGLYVFDARRPERAIMLSGSENCIVTAIEKLDEQFMLVGTDGNGLKICAVSPEQPSIDDITPLQLLADDSPFAPYLFPLSVVKGILADQGHIWVSMDIGGVALMNPGSSLSRLSVPNQRNVSDNYVYGADFDHDGQLWIAFNNSLACFDRDGKNLGTYLDHQSRFLAVKHTIDGTVWAGGFNTGLYHFDPVTLKQEHITSIADQPVLDCIYSIYEDSYHDLWIGGLNFPLTRLHFTKAPTKGKLDCQYERTHYPVNQVSDILEFNADTMVISTFDGFYIVDRNTGETTSRLRDIDVWSYTNAIGAIAKRGDDELWIATTGAGLLCYNMHTDEIEAFNLSNGIPSIELRGVEMLNDSLLCASTENNGIFLFDAKNRRYLNNLSQSEFVGINQFIRSASASSGDGCLVFGSDQGAVLLDLEDIRDDVYPYEILIEGEYVTNDSLVHLPASDRNLNLEFTTTDIYDQSVYRFQYRIRGLVDEWQQVDASRKIRFLAVPAGTYTMEVRAIDASNRFRTQQVLVKVDRELFLRWYFIVGYIILILALCFFAAIWAVNYIMRRNDGQPHPSRTTLASISSFRKARINYRLMVKQSETDALTGLLNRYAGREQVSQLLQERTAGVFLLMDCDKFKQVNDTYGHLVGDELLCSIAKVMRHTFPNDISIRLGGDEFAMFLKGCYTQEQVHAQANRFFEAIQAIRLSADANYVPSVSIGAAFAASGDEARENFQSLYSQADKCLYQSKKQSGCSITLPE